MRNRLAALVMAALVLLYIGLLGRQAWIMLTSGTVVGVIAGLALLVFPLLGLWALWREVAFGFQTQALVRRLEAEDGLPLETAPLRASGRPEREAADADFPRYKAEVEANPESWRAWFRLGLAYDASGDRRRARWALREAITKSRRDLRGSVER